MSKASHFIHDGVVFWLVRYTAVGNTIHATGRIRDRDLSPSARSSLARVATIVDAHLGFDSGNLDRGGLFSLSAFNAEPPINGVVEFSCTLISPA